MNSEYTHTWEEAVAWLRQQPDQQEQVRANYYDDPLSVAAERFYRSEEWRGVEECLRGRLPASVLDIGAGRGISSYAFARAGCEITALEPSSSALVGAGAIHALASDADLRIDVVQQAGESMPFDEGTFDVVYCRAALHHAADLQQLCREAARVLRPGGVFLATREHVLTRRSDLQTFLDKHTLHFLYGGEHAYTLQEYVQALEGAGLTVKRKLGPLDSVVNYAPMPTAELVAKIESILSRRFGRRAGRRLASYGVLRKLIARLLSRRSDSPGRLYAFLAVKPADAAPA